VAVHLSFVAVTQLVPGVHRRARCLVQPDAVYDARVGGADDAERQQILNTDEEQSVGVAEVETADLRERRVAERLRQLPFGRSQCRRRRVFVRDVDDVECDGGRDTGGDADHPDDGHDSLGQSPVEARLQRPHHGAVSVDGDHDQRADAHVHRNVADERRDRAQRLRQVPALQQRRLELERDAEDADDHVGAAEVGDKEVGDGLHAAVRRDDGDDERVAEYRGDRQRPVERAQQRHDTRRRAVQLAAVVVDALRQVRETSVHTGSGLVDAVLDARRRNVITRRIPFQAN